MWYRLGTLAVVVLMVVVTGCGRTQSQRVQPPPVVDELRKALNEVAQTGELGSTAMLIREKVEALKAADPAKAQVLAGDVDELEKLDGKPQQAKAKAQEMLNKLGS